MDRSIKEIVVIGGGVAGIVAAYLLSEKYSVTLIEKNERLGGHTNTVTIDRGPDAGVKVDTGFIVCNDRTYPNFHRFLRRLDVPVRDADMSFGYYSEVSGLQYAGTGIRGLFAQKRNLLRPAFIRMLRELTTFNRQGLEDIEGDFDTQVTLRKYISRYGYSEELVRDYLVPMGAAIWSSPDDGILDFPASTFLQFFKNHGLLTLSDRPQWQTVVGGSSAYVDAFKAQFQGELLLGVGVDTIRRNSEGVSVVFDNGSEKNFDHAVIATHADITLRLLDRPSDDERKLLGVWEYHKNPTVLHSDASVMPPKKPAWASWNYTREHTRDGGTPVSVTYHMNRLQGLQCEREYFTTLNRSGVIDPELVYKEIEYDHPVFTSAAVESQRKLDTLQGKENTYFCGSYFGYGFHEDAVKSSVAVASMLGAEL